MDGGTYIRRKALSGDSEHNERFVLLLTLSGTS